jgi:hypothetical protein
VEFGRVEALSRGEALKGKFLTAGIFLASGSHIVGDKVEIAFLFPGG